MSELEVIYANRFIEMGVEKRDRVWKILCSRFFQRYVPAGSHILDLACGYGEFINNIEAGKKYAIDLNSESPRYLAKSVEFHSTPADQLGFLSDASIDVVFTSNFLEHLPNKQVCTAVIREVHRVLRPGGKFMILGPNIRFVTREYWDYYDHYLPLSDRSLAEGLSINGFTIDTVIPQFLPYTMKNNAPTADVLIKAYLALPLAWRLFGKQFFVVGRRPAAEAAQA